MKFWLSLMAVSELDQLAEIARYAEELGFHGVTYADHLVMPTKIASRYPYTEDGEMFWPPQTPWPDPWICLAVMGTVTRTLKLGTNIYLAALRDPFTPAKMVASLAAVAGDRVMCGVSAGWIKEEYDLAGVDFATRGKRLDEMLAVTKKLWTGEPVTHAGTFFNVEAIMQPAPKAPVPIWAGGMSKGALRRAAENDGWLGLPMTLEQNLGVIGTMHDLRRSLGRKVEDFSPCISLAEPMTQHVVDEFRRHHAHDFTAMPWFPTPWDIKPHVDPGADIRELEVKKTAMRRYAETVIAKFGGQ